jgi:hypothetical protein
MSLWGKILKKWRCHFAKLKMSMVFQRKIVSSHTDGDQRSNRNASDGRTLHQKAAWKREKSSVEKMVTDETHSG